MGKKREPFIDEYVDQQRELERIGRGFFKQIWPGHESIRTKQIAGPQPRQKGRTKRPGSGKRYPEFYKKWTPAKIRSEYEDEKTRLYRSLEDYEALSPAERVELEKRLPDRAGRSVREKMRSSARKMAWKLNKPPMSNTRIWQIFNNAISNPIKD